MQSLTKVFSHEHSTMHSILRAVTRHEPQAFLAGAVFGGLLNFGHSAGLRCGGNPRRAGQGVVDGEE
jgi:hypothetical protein